MHTGGDKEMEDLVDKMNKTMTKVLKMYKNQAKELVKQYDEGMGDLLESADRFIQSARNVIQNQIKERKVFPIDSISIGDHLCVDKGLYSHHGLYIGGRDVLHYDNGHVYTIKLDDFLGPQYWEIVDSPLIYEIDVAIQRGLSRLGESKYNIVLNNCEHFVIWCRGGSELTDAI
jgi:hypothetical protein